MKDGHQREKKHSGSLDKASKNLAMAKKRSDVLKEYKILTGSQHHHVAYSQTERETEGRDNFGKRN